MIKPGALGLAGLSVMAIAVGAAMASFASAAQARATDEQRDMPGGQGGDGVGAAAPAAPAAPAAVVVTGMRSTNLRSIAAKQDADLIVDTVAADQVGKLPDFNVGDALKRVTGVNVLLYQGEPRYVILRGLNGNYNTVQIDGFALASGDVGSRQQLMEMLPSNFASRIDVTKSFMPESDGGAVGGVVNMLTAGGFSLPDRSLTVSAKAGRNLMNEEYGGSTPIGEASGKWARRFGANDEFAFLASASYWTRRINVPQSESGGSMNWYNANGTRSATPYSGNGYAVPTQRLWYNYDDLRQRRGLTARLDWHPSDDVSGHVSAFHFKQREDADRNTQNASVNATSTVSAQTPTSGTLGSVNQLIQLGRLRWTRALDGVNGELNVQVDRDWKTDLRASSSRATVDNPQVFDNYTQSNMAFGYDWSGAGAPMFTPVNAANAADPARYAFTTQQRTEQNYRSNVQDLQWNLKRNMGEEARGVGLALGLRAVRTDTGSRFTSLNLNNKPFTLADVLAGGALCGLGCNANMLLIDPVRVDAMLQANTGVGATVVNTAAQYGATYGVEERVGAGYLQVRYKTDLWMVAGGVRLEHTRDGMTGWSQANNGWSPVDSEHSDRQWLPSLLVVYNTGDSSKLRVGLSQTLGRPRWDQLATTGGMLSSGVNPTLSMGNTALKPRRANNFDLGHDWYLDGGKGILSMALFYKQIRDEIFTWGENRTLEVNGVPTTVLVTQPRNAADQVSLSGVELGLTKDLDSLTPALKGFGVSANASFTKAHYPVTLQNGALTTSRTLSAMPQQPRQMWNFTLYYELDRVHARLAWNHVGRLWDDRYPNYTAANFYANRYQQPTDNVDLQLGYDLSRRLTLSLDVINATGQDMQYKYGSNQEYQQSAWKLAPSVLFGLNYKL